MRVRTEPKLAYTTLAVAAVLLAGILPASSGCDSLPFGSTDATPLPSPSATATPSALADESGEQAPTAEPLPAETATLSLVVHVVQEGDTLSGIADKYGVPLDELLASNDLPNPDFLSLGQEILVPAAAADVPGPPATATAEETQPDAPEVTAVTATALSPAEPGTPVPTPTSSGPPLVEIAQTLGSSVLGEEAVIIRNRGGAASLEDWTLSGSRGNSYTLPAVTLYRDAEVRIHSRTGTDRPSDLYLGLVEPAWEAGELITLRSALGEVVDTYIVP